MTVTWPLKANAALLLQPDIDTDLIMPKQYLKGIDRSGLSDGLFRPLRFLADGTPDPSFPLNHSPGNEAQILVTGPNFGCGSSREHAVWGLQQRGIRAIVGSSFAGIFCDNALNNGLLIVELAPSEVSEIAAAISAMPSIQITIDLARQRIEFGKDSLDFAIKPERRNQMLKGEDRIAGSLALARQMAEFELAYSIRYPWLLAKP